MKTYYIICYFIVAFTASMLEHFAGKGWGQQFMITLTYMSVLMILGKLDDK